jgi:CheY-like chemotaxis protein
MHGLVLIVEDDEDIRTDLAALLAAHGYDTETAANGAEAIERMSISPPCLVLLDLMMPVMDGWALRSEMTKLPAMADVPIVVLSGGSDVPTAAQTIGAVGFVTKPFKLRTLLDVIGQHCVPRTS